MPGSSGTKRGGVQDVARNGHSLPVKDQRERTTKEGRIRDKKGRTSVAKRVTSLTGGPGELFRSENYLARGGLKIRLAERKRQRKGPSKKTSEKVVFVTRNGVKKTKKPQGQSSGDGQRDGVLH